ncbi:MAG: redoxin [Marinilabiliales bacterium]|nr:MAG: redoxin [Marinilabiliales bacterium]
MIKKSSLIISSIILLNLIVIVAFAQNQKDSIIENRGYIVNIGDKPDNINFTFTDGSTISLDELKGKVVVLQFTASWCSVCRKEMPHLEKEVWQRFKDDDFILIGVDFDEPLEKVKSFKEQMKTTYPMALDKDALIFQKFALKKSGVTRNVILDKSGEIDFLTRLYERKEFEDMISKIESLLE